MLARIMCMVDHLVKVPFMEDHLVMVPIMVVHLAIRGTSCKGDLLDICKVDSMDQCMEGPMVIFKDLQECQGVQA